MPYPRAEIEAAVERYVEVRKVIDAGGATWSALAQFFTDDAVFIDPAWGRVEGIDEMKATVFGDAMVGLEEWKFPVEFYAIEGDNVIIKWKQTAARQPARRPPVGAVGRLDADLRRRRQVPLRRGSAQHGPRARRHAGEQVQGARGRHAARAPEPRLLPSERLTPDPMDDALQERSVDYVAITPPAERVRRRGDPPGVGGVPRHVPRRRAGPGRHRHQSSSSRSPDRRRSATSSAPRSSGSSSSSSCR